MVTIGFSKPYVAKYSNEGNKVTYSEGMALGRGVSLSLDIETSDDNNFYADNVLAETESAQFTSGSAAITVDGLANAAAALIFGLPSVTKEVTVGDATVKLQGYGKKVDPPFCGYGCVRKTQMNGVISYWPVILPKIKFAMNSDEMTTQGSSIDWQTQELNATVLRDDTEEGNWKLISEEGMATEDAAYEVVTEYLGGAAE